MFALRPANAEPLLLAAEVKAYSTSEKPCAPELVIELPVRPAAPSPAPVPISTSAGVIRM